MLRTEIAEQSDSSWRAFEDLLAVLQQAGALEGSAPGVPDIADAEGEQQQQKEQAQQPDPRQQQQQAPQQAQLAAGAAAATAASARAPSSSSGADGDGGGGTRIAFTALGQVAREVNCANELWMAMVLSHSAVQGLPPPQLAAVLSAGWRSPQRRAGAGAGA